jgi:hypothetical protein
MRVRLILAALFAILLALALLGFVLRVSRTVTA